MTTRLPTRDQLVSILTAVRSEPEGPDQAAAIERLEAQLAALDEPDANTLVGPDADLVAQPLDEDVAAKPAAPAAPAPPAKPAPPFGKKPDEPAKKPDDRANNKPF